MNYVEAAKLTSNASAVPSLSPNSHALNDDSSDTSETNSELREEAHSIFNSTAPTQRTAWTHGYHTNAFPGQKKPASSGGQSPPEKNKKSNDVPKNRIKKLKEEEYKHDALIPSKPNIEINVHLWISKPPRGTTKYQMNSLTQ